MALDAVSINNLQGKKDQQCMYVLKLASIIDNAEEQHICVLGDFKATHGTSVFSVIQRKYNDRDMVIADVRTPSDELHLCQPREPFSHMAILCGDVAMLVA